MIDYKEAFEKTRSAGKIAAGALDEVAKIAKPGTRTDQIDSLCYEFINDHGAYSAPLFYRGFPKSCCTSANHVVCHGIPSDKVLKDGDIINVDVTCILNGYYGDSCRMYEVGTVSESSKKLIHVTKECLDLAIKSVKPYKSINVIGDTIEKHAQKYNYGVVSMFGGHGIGKKFHEEPFVYHCKRKEHLMVMLPGMIFTIEPMINIGKKDIKILGDGWTAVTKDKKLSAQYEHTVGVTKNGYEVFTLSKKEKTNIN